MFNVCAVWAYYRGMALCILSCMHMICICCILVVCICDAYRTRDARLMIHTLCVSYVPLMCVCTCLYKMQISFMSTCVHMTACRYMMNISDTCDVQWCMHAYERVNTHAMCMRMRNTCFHAYASWVHHMPYDTPMLCIWNVFVYVAYIWGMHGLTAHVHMIAYVRT